MATGKARYTGPEGIVPHGLDRDALRETLKNGLAAFELPPLLFQNAEHPSPEFAAGWREATGSTPEDEFIDQILSVAMASRIEKEALHGLTKADIQAEWLDLTKRLEKAERGLRTISPQVENLIEVGADLLACAEQIAKTRRYLEAARPAIDRLPHLGTPEHREHDIALRLTKEVLDILTDYGIKPSATYNPDYNTKSDAVRILTVVGEVADLERSSATWRDLISEAKK